MSKQKPTLDTCGCCDGIELKTPQEISNTPGLNALLFRVGRHGAFKESMLRQLSEALPLRDLATREDDDHTIALLDAWAVVLDVLTFYQERLINEGFIRTSRERFSLAELSRHISYLPKPGVAAGTWFSFLLEESVGAPTQVVIPIGTKVQSIPEQDEKPQVFETIEKITGRTQWNAMKPRLAEAQTLGHGSTSLYLQGTGNLLQSGDALLIVGKERLAEPGSERWDIRTVTSVELDDANNRTLVNWRVGLGHTDPLVYPGSKARVYVFKQRAAIFGYNAPDPRSFIDDVATNYEDDYNSDANSKPTDWKRSKVISNSDKTIFLDAEYPKIQAGSWLALADAGYTELYRLDKVEISSVKAFTLANKVSKATFDTGENMGQFSFRDTLVLAQSEELPLGQSPIFAPVYGKVITLDKDQPGLRAGQKLIVSGELVEQVQVAKLTTYFKSGEEIIESTKTLHFHGDDNSVTSLATGDILKVTGIPFTTPDNLLRWPLSFNGATGHVDLAEEGLLLPYVPESSSNVPEPPTSLNQPVVVSELVEIREMADPGQIILVDPLENMYRRDSVTINGNVAQATHGETKVEILGSGDGARPFQKFTLKQSPLTYIASSSSTGSESTLEIRVNDILWEEERTFYGQSGQGRIFITRQEDDGAVHVQFGNGVTGARLPSGSDNIRATYRTGTGFEGLLKANQLSLLMTPQLGLKSATNPMPTTGADEPESLANIRTNAPLTVLTLDRIVSVKDYENFANAYAGIGKARADLLWKGEGRTVHLTVASADAGEIDSTLHDNLLEAINNARHENFPVVISSFQEKLFNLIARIKIDPDYLAEKVIPAVKALLLDTFSFNTRVFGQDVTPSEAIAAIQSVDGVLAVDLEEIGGQDPFAGEHFRLVSDIARWDNETILPASLLLIDPDNISITSMDA
ncbi:MAG: putative baseplate assembly protein [Lewinellaceae bacterium]|nr:putative baseplate assembly protein [Lewinellaceae bacterium]MCB9286259.1 putative baseplate assembly protein [Lewinellaceae bacterium]